MSSFCWGFVISAKYKEGDTVWCRCYSWMDYEEPDYEDPDLIYVGPAKIIFVSKPKEFKGDYLVSLPLKKEEFSTGNWAVKEEWIDHVIA